MMREALWMVALMAAMGCSKSEKKDAPAAEPPKVAATVVEKAGSAVAAVEAKVEAKVEQGKEMIANISKEGLTATAYEQLIGGLASCGIKGYEIDQKCPGMLALREAMKQGSTGIKDLAGMNAAVGKKMIGHSAAPVRLYAAGLMGGLFGTDSSAEDTIVEAAKKELDLGVLQNMIRTVANSGAKSSKVAELLIASADHADTAVRTQAVYAISSSWNREMKGGPEKLAAMIEGDKDPKVREAACEYAGHLGAKSLVATYEKFTAKADEPKLQAKCLEGLVAMFHDYPLYGTGEPAAYKLFLTRLAAKPRTADNPPWSLMDAFANYGDDAKNDKLAAWKKQATWFKPAEVKKVLADVIADKQANWMARTGAVASMLGLGASKAELEAIKKKYGEPTGDDTHVVKKLDEAIATAK